MNTPDFINELGVKWWLEKSLTQYAQHKGLSNTRVWLVEEPSGRRTRLLVEGDAILADDQSLEGMGIKIDALSFARK